MRKSLLFFLFVLILPYISLTAAARQLSVGEARQNAERFLRAGTAAPLGTGGTSSALRLVYEAKPAQTAEPAFYVFDRGNNNGFIVVSADDRLREVLGYSTSGKFDINTIPENMKWWLGEYEREIEAFLKEAENPRPTSPMAMAKFNAIPTPTYTPANGTATQATLSIAGNDKPFSMPAVAPTAQRAISPLVKTLWNQSEPFNDLCPIDGDERSVTGCVATAMAQIMNYHQWPQGPGKGSYSYTTGRGTPMSFDFSTTTFDWNNMLDDYYNTNPSQAQKNAVATLMLACGVSVNMNYTKGESGAMGCIVPWALVKYFGYNTGARTVNRIGYSAEEWDALVYNELANNRPVFYAGRSDYGGHAFVCDGYDGDGYFHINWGWGGYCDDYFALSALNPDGQGIGGYEGGYNQGQEIGIGIQRPTSGNDDAMGYTITADADFTYEADNNSFFLSGKIYTEYMENANFYMAAEVVPEGSTGEGELFKSNSLSSIRGGSPTEGYYIYSSFSFTAPISGLEPGNYLIYPAYVDENGRDWNRIHCPKEKQAYVTLTVGDNGSYTYFNNGSKVSADIKVTEFEAQGTIYANSTTTFKLTVENYGDGDFNGIINLSVRRPGSTESLYSDRFTIGVAAGKKTSGTINFNFKLDPGNYTAVFTDAAGNEINATEFPIEVVEDTRTTPIWISLNSPSEFYKGYSTTLSMTITNSSANDYPVDAIFGFYNPGDSDWIYAMSGSVTIPNGSYTVNFSGFSSGKLPAGKYDFLITDKNGTALSERTPVYVYEEQGGLWFGVEDGAAFVVSHPTTPYSGTVTVPANVSINNTEYNVTSIKDGAFANASGITTMFFKPTTMTFGNVAATFAGVPAETDIYVPAEAYDIYAAALSKLENKVYSTIDVLQYTFLKGKPNDLKAGDEFKLRLDPRPISTHFNPEFSFNIPDNVLELLSNEPDGKGNVELLFKAVAEGSGMMTITSAQPESQPAAIPLNVTKADAIAPTALKLDRSEASIVEGESLKLVASVEPEDATYTEIIWTSDNEEVATVDAEGKVTAIAAGTAKITATCGELTAECAVTVTTKRIEPTALKLDRSEASIVEGESLKLTASVEPEGATYTEITWTSDNEEVATVDAEGTVTAIAAGTAKITAACGEFAAECAVTVTTKRIEPTALKLDRSEASIVEGESLKLVASIEPENATYTEITWTSDNEEVATVDTEGTVTAIATGTAKITATCGELTAECAVAVCSKLDYKIVSEEDKTCEVTMKAEGEYTGNIVIPTATQINGETYRVIGIDYMAFWGCSATSIIIPEGIEYILSSAFWYCHNIQSIHLPSTLRIINFGNPFSSCRSLMDISVDASNEMFESVDGVLYSKDLTKILAVPGGRTDHFEIPSSVETIGTEALHGCTMLSSITIPNSIKHIERTAFFSCSQVAQISIPSSVETIAEGAFGDMTSVERISVDAANKNYIAGNDALFTYDKKSIIAYAIGKSVAYDMPAGVENIGDYTFFNSQLPYMKIPDSVKRIGSLAICNMSYCKSLYIGSGVSNWTVDFSRKAEVPLEEVTINIPDPATVKCIDRSFSAADFESATLYVPYGSGDAYRNADGWKNFAKIVEMMPDAPTGLSLDREKASIVEGESLKLKAIVEPEGFTGAEIAWSSDNEDVATVDAEGTVTAIAAGTATITATCGELSATCSVTVTTKKIEPTGLSIIPEKAELVEGESLKLKAIVEPENATFSEISWASDNEDVATVDADGTVTAIATGTATITATCGELSATCSVTVTAKKIEPTDLILNRSTASIVEGESLKLSATVEPEDATYTEITWASDNEDVATVDADGTVTAIAAGTATITATCGELSATCTVTVTAKKIEPTGITIDQTSATIEKYETLQLNATVEPEGAEYSELVWSSSDETVAIVDSYGTVTAKSMGTAMITVSLADNPTLSATCVVTVTDKSGIDGVDSGEITIKAANKAIEVKGAAEGTEIMVYNTSGRLVTVRRAESGTTRIALSSGMYVVRVGRTTAKIAL